MGIFRLDPTQPGGIAMIQTLVLSSILMTLPAQAGERRSSMLGGKPAAKDNAGKGSAKAPAAKGDVAKKPAKAPAAKDEAGDAAGDALATYNGLREKTPHTVAAQSKLAAWCEAHGLKAEAYVHYAEVVRLDPKREAAWRKLGYKKYGNQWMTEAEIAEAERQKKLDKTWGPRLDRIHKDIHGAHGAKRADQARDALAAITDPDAIPSLYREFGHSGQIDQLLLIQVLGQIDKPLSTQVLAMMSVYGRTPEVRRRAAEFLRNRPSRDFLELLVGLMVDPLKYEVKPVAGPGSPGVLLVEGERFNVARYYAPQTVNIPWRPGDIVSYDASGMPGITRLVGATAITPVHGVAGSKTLVSQTEQVEFARVSAAQIMAENQRSAAAAEAQLEGDVAQIQAINGERRRFTDIVVTVAAYATGKDPGPDPKDWREAVAGGPNSTKETPKEKPTITEMVPMAYQPQVVPTLSFMRVTNTWTDS